MTCPCTGELIKFNRYRPNRENPYAQCNKCHKEYTWFEYRSLQADKIAELVRKEETPE